MKVASKITGVVLASLIVGLLFGSLPSGAYAVTFGIGDTVEVYNTGSDGLYVLDAPCGNVIGGKFDGERGVVLDGPVFCAGHDRWLIRWNDGLEGWSAENWLRKVQTELALPDLKVTSVNAPVSAEPGGYIAVSWTIENQGNASSDSFHTRISLATTPYGTDISLGNFSMDSIAAGSSLSDTQVPRIPESVPPGYYYVTVYADGFQSISESDENNNIDKAPSQINIPVETVSTPNIPSGPTTGTTSTSYTYSTGGASSNLEHSLEYRFDWGDGSYSGWSSSTSDSHSWSSPSVYIVKAQARCTTHTSIISGWSSELTMDIPPPEEETMGTIDVTSDPSGASFTLSGPTNYSGTTPWIMTDAPTGTYTITWGSMSGYTTPLPETKPLTQGGTISFYGLYQAIEETVSTPDTPSGPTTGTTGTGYTYSTGGASSNLEHSLEYRFDWGDGSYSGWSSSTSDSHSWSSPSTYIVRARARCATHTSIISGWSSELTVNIPPPPDQLPPAPSINSPGLTTPPGNVIDDLTPTFTWNAVAEADYYGLYIRDVDADTLAFNSQDGDGPVYGTSFDLPSGVLNYNKHYQWNMNSHSSVGWGVGYSDRRYFITPQAPPTITDQQKQQEILNMVNNHRGAIPPELVLAIIRQEGGAGAFHVDGWNYDWFYSESDSSWAQPNNNPYGIMQVEYKPLRTSGEYTNDQSGYDHSINDGCNYLKDNYNGYGSYVQATLHYNTGPDSLYIYSGLNAGERNYLSNVAGHLSNFVPNTYGLQNQELVSVLNQGQNILDNYLDNVDIATGQPASYYQTDQAQLDSDLHNIGTSYPIVESFNVQPSSITQGEQFTISHTVSDTGGSGLKQVELWRANDVAGTPDWDEPDNPIQIVPLSGNSYTGQFEDTPPASGAYWYGLHVVNNNDLWNDERNSHSGHLPGVYGPIRVDVTTPVETVSTPSIPSGPTTGTTDTSYTYSTGGASSSLEHSLEYCFDWGDDSYSNWSSSASDSHSWSSPGTYIVRARARCATHTSVISGWSSELTVNIPPPKEETTGTIDVTSDPLGASFSVSGPTNYSGTTPWIKTDAPTGTYTITWGSMSGYTTPLPETKPLTQGETISFYGLYHIPPPDESDHPYDNDFVYTWTIWESGMVKIRIHFTKIELALNDYIYILDKDDRELTHYCGTGLTTTWKDHWTDWFCVDTLKVKLETNRSYTAYGFKIDRIETRPPPNYVLEIGISGQGSTDPIQGIHTYDEGAEVTITATPDDLENWRFDRWEGNAQGTDPSVTITMDSNKSITACFVSIDDYPKIDDSPQPDNVVLESEHPYDSGCVNNWSIWTSGPDKVRLHFHKIELALNDCISILDRDRELACYRGIDFKTTWEDHWTDWFTVSPHTLQVELETNDSFTAWGFLIDQLEVKPKAKVNSISPSRVEVGRVGEEVISLSGDGTDPDGSVEACEWRSSIDGQLSTSSSFTTSESDLSEGNHTIYFKVRDNDGNWSEEAIGTVTIEPNRPPIASINSISPTRITVGEKVSFSGSGTDSEGKVVAYQWRSSIDGPLPTLSSFTTPVLSEGTHTIYFKVRDNHGDWSPEVSGTVAVINEPPIANIDSISPHGGGVGDEVSFSGSGTDSDGTVVAYQWRSDIDGPLLTSKSFTTPVLSEGTHIIYFKVRDNHGKWSPEVSGTVTVGPPTLPIANIDSISPNRVGVGDEVSFSGSGTDSDGTVVGYEWRSDIDGPLPTLSSFTTSALSEGTHTIYFKVIDNDGKWSPEVSGTVAVINEPPIANIDSISPHGGGVGDEVSFSGSGTDSDGTVVAYEWWSDIDGPLLTSKSFTTPALSEGTHTIYFKVRDNHGKWSPEVSNTVIVERDRPYFKIHVSRVHLEVGEDAIVQVTVGNLITSPGDMETDITMSIPSGWSIIEWSFFQAVGGLQSAKFTIERGRERSCSVRIQANEPGKRKVTGSIDYWFTDESGGRISEEFHRTESVDVTAAIDLIIETNGQGTTDPNPGKHRCDKDEEVTITATPDPEWRFSHWEGEVPRTSSRSITITMHTSKKITACFSPESPPPRPPLYLIISIIAGSLILVAGFSTLVMRRRRRRST